MKNLISSLRTASILSSILIAMLIFPSCEREEIAPVSNSENEQILVASGPGETASLPVPSPVFEPFPRSVPSSYVLQPAQDTLYTESIPSHLLPDPVLGFLSNNYHNPVIKKAYKVYRVYTGFICYAIYLGNGERLQLSKVGTQVFILEDSFWLSH